MSHSLKRVKQAIFLVILYFNHIKKKVFFFLLIDVFLPLDYKSDIHFVQKNL